MKKFWILAVFLVACGDAGSSDVSDTQDPDTSGKGDIYGTDDRSELFDRDVLAAHKRVAAATAIAVSPAGIRDINSSQVTLNNISFATRQRATLGGPLCSSERFLSQPAPGFCSAFLIAPDLVATAGHCVNRDVPVHEANYVFGFGYETIGSTVTTLPRNNVYQGKTVVGHIFDQGELNLQDTLNGEMWEDWAVVQLDRPVTGRTPVSLREAAVVSGELATAIGHPSGLPTKVTPGTVVDASKSKFYNTDLDIYQGNSGSLVADQNGEAIGIVIRGSGGDSFTQTADGCYASKRCESVGSTAACIGNHVMRAYPLHTFADPTIRRVISQGALSPTVAIPDGTSTGMVASRTVTDSGAIEYVTLNVNLFHAAPQELEFYLEHNGKTVAVSKRPRVWKGGNIRFSRTTYDFAGLDAQGEWRLRVVDPTAGATTSQYVEWWQLVLGVGNGRVQPVQPVEPEPTPAFVGTPCASNADCGFSVGGVTGVCYNQTFCTLPCQGYCPDSAGFAPTFCVASDAGAGICASRMTADNNYCAAIPNTRGKDAARYIGSSSAPAVTKSVCLP
ncbi:MAG: serine protease [bacterium]